MRIALSTYAIAFLVASTVGVGFFGIPSSFAQSGTGIGLIFLILLGGLVLLTNLAYGEIVLRTHQRHQFVGYVRRYLGHGARIVNQINFWIAAYGSLLGIIIINGLFASSVLAYAGIHISNITLGSAFMIIAVVLVSYGLRTVSHVDFGVLCITITVIILIALVGFPHIARENFVFVGNGNLFLPFGVILFSLNGLSGIPLVREVLIGKEEKYRRTILFGTMIPFAAYLVFSLVVVGVTGIHTSEEAVRGLSAVLGDWVTVAGSFFGFLTSATIFLSVITAFKKTLQEDFQFRRRRYFFILLLPPLLLYWLGAHSFVKIIGLVGGVAVSIDMILLLFVYARAKDHGNRIPEYSLNIPNVVLYAMMFVFMLGAIYTLVM